MNYKIALLVICTIACKSIYAQEEIKINYPKTPKMPSRELYGKNIILDDYSFLEDDKSQLTNSWVDSQIETTERYIREIPFRNNIRQRLTSVWNYAKQTSPYIIAKNEFYYKNNGTQNQSVLYRKNALTGEMVILDPNKLSNMGTTSISSYAISKNAKYMAYALSEAGSDWNTIYIMDLTTLKVMTNNIKWSKFSSLSWKGDEGFYFCKYPTPSKNASTLSNENSNQKIFFYNIKAIKNNETLIYENLKFNKRTFGAELTDDEKYLMIYESESTSGNSLFIKDLASNKIYTVSNNFDNEWGVIKNDKENFYILTNNKASNKRVISYNLLSKQIIDVVAETKNVIEFIVASKTKFFISWLNDVKSKPAILDFNGKILNEISLNTIGQVSDVNVNKETGDFYYALSTFVAPSSIYKLNVKTAKSDLIFEPKCDFDSRQFSTEQFFVTARDGKTKIPIFVTKRLGIPLDGKNPCFLFGYGGFSSHYAPEFRADRTVFLEQGGIYVVAGIRGGDEYGEEWHKQGIKENKINVFTDFIDVANYLCENGITSHEKLAIHGRSNGGLLIGAVMTMEPKLAKVAIPSVGVLDMLKYNKFTIGYLWESDYGSAQNPNEFNYLLSYSPYHNIKPNDYPATLITTGDHDDRVVPAHSFKFAAKLQELNRSENPILIRIDKNAGHGSGKPISMQIDEFTDIWTFVMFHLGMNFRK